MDWGKAKTQMIYVFLILNIFLATLLWKDTNLTTDDFDVKEELKRHKIELKAKIPQKTEAPSVRLEYELYDKDKLKELFFIDPIIDDKADVTVLSEGFKKIVVINKKLLRYSNIPEERPDKIKNLTDAQIEAKRFLRRYGMEENMVIKNSTFKYDLFSIEFAQIDKKTHNYLESAFTTIQLGENGVVAMERQTFREPIKQKGVLKMKDPKRKLLKLIDIKEARDKTVVDVSICYIFDPGKNPYVNNPEKAAGGIPNLGLRVQLDDGYVVLLD